MRHPIRYLFAISVLSLLTNSFATDLSQSTQNHLSPGQSVPVNWSNDGDPRWKLIESATTLFSFKSASDISDWHPQGCWKFGLEQSSLKTSDENILFVTGDFLSYPNDANDRITSSEITLPRLPHKYNQILLTIDETYQLESDYDYGNIEISSDQGRHWQVLDTRTGSSVSQIKSIIDLTWFAGNTIQLGFRISSNSTHSFAGWSVGRCDLYQTNQPIINSVDETDNLSTSMVNINSQCFPVIFSNVSVTFDSSQVNGLAASAFHVTENNIPQTDLFSVVPPDSNNGNRLADIVFVLDVTGSMGEEIESVRRNMESFVSTLISSEVNCNIGFVVFGDIVYRYNEGNLYSDMATVQSILTNIRLGEHGIGSGSDEPENQLGALAVANAMNFRPGAQRNLILLTDAPSHENDGVTTYTTAQVQTMLVGSHSILFPIFDTNDSRQIAQYVTLARATNPTGTYFNVYANFNAIISQISSMISNTYLITYRSNIPANVTQIRTVVIQTAHRDQISTCSGSYNPNSAPAISRTEQTLLLHTQSLPANSPVVISVNVVDNVTPFISRVSLYYKNLISTSYSQATMNLSGTSYTATIPASSIVWPGIIYYFAATDGQSTTTNPSSNPTTFPYTLAVSPNHSPQINFTPPPSYSLTGGRNDSISIDATITDSTVIVMRSRLFYRVFPNLLYQTVEMTDTTNHRYHGAIPAGIATNEPIEYVLYAEDENCIATTIGTFDQPLAIQPSR